MSHRHRHHSTDVVLDVTDAAACSRFAAEADPAVWADNAVLLGPDLTPNVLLRRVLQTSLLGTIRGPWAAWQSCAAGPAAEVRAASPTSARPGSGSREGDAVDVATKAAALSFTLALRWSCAQQGVSGINLSCSAPAAAHAAGG